MPHHKSAKKRVKQTTMRTALNRSQMSAARTAIKKVRAAITGKDKKAALAAIPQMQSLLARLAKKGVVARNTAARKVGRLSTQAGRL